MKYSLAIIFVLSHICCSNDDASLSSNRKPSDIESPNPEPNDPNFPNSTDSGGGKKGKSVGASRRPSSSNNAVNAGGKAAVNPTVIERVAEAKAHAWNLVDSVKKYDAIRQIKFFLFSGEEYNYSKVKEYVVQTKGKSEDEAKIEFLRNNRNEELKLSFPTDKRLSWMVLIEDKKRVFHATFGHQGVYRGTDWGVSLDNFEKYMESKFKVRKLPDEDHLDNKGNFIVSP